MSRAFGGCFGPGRDRCWHDPMGVGVKVRAKLDRVSGRRALRLAPSGSTMLRPPVGAVMWWFRLEGRACPSGVKGVGSFLVIGDAKWEWTTRGGVSHPYAGPCEGRHDGVRGVLAGVVNQNGDRAGGWGS